MAKFIGPALDVLTRIYPLTGSGVQRLDRIDLDAPIQTVHDVSREAELGSGFYATVVFSQEIVLDATTTFAETDVDSLTLIALRGKYGPFRSQTVEDSESRKYESWLLSLSAIENNANLVLTGAQVALKEPSGGNSGALADPVSTYELLCYFSTEGLAQFSGGGSPLLQTATGMIPLVNRPRRLVPGSSVSFSSRTSAGALATRGILFQFRLWVGKAGTSPPGMS